MKKLLVFLSVAWMGLFVACESTLPIENAEPAAAVEQESSRGVAYDDLQTINFGGRSLEKTTTVYQWINKGYGGTIINQHYGNGGLYVYNSLQILPNTIPNSQWLGVRIDDQNFQGAVDVQYGPHGLVFAQPAIMNLYAAGLDLSNLDPSSVDIYYDNTENGQWEEMPNEGVIVDVAAGTIMVLNARIPHFSRYAIGTEY